MVSWKVLVVMLVLCILVQQLDAQRNRTRGANRRNRNRGNRNRGRGRRPGRGGGRPGSARNNCEEIQVPMCKGLVGYTHTLLPNRFNHTSQLQVYRVLEHLWGEIDAGCSQNFRLVACSLYLPRCFRRGPAREPCRKTCKQTQRVCRPRLENLGFSWPELLDCNVLPKRRCLKLRPHHSCDQDYTSCQSLELPMCQGLRFSEGMLPNMFGQCNGTEIAMEMEQFSPLVASGCSADLAYFLCAVYMPFCNQGVIYFPCRELCQQVRSSCEATYTQLSGGLPWPNKFQCHRYPSASDENYQCTMPDDAPTPSASLT